MGNHSKALASSLALLLSVGLISGCGSTTGESQQSASPSPSSTSSSSWSYDYSKSKHKYGYRNKSKYSYGSKSKGIEAYGKDTTNGTDPTGWTNAEPEYYKVMGKADTSAISSFDHAKSNTIRYGKLDGLKRVTQVQAYVRYDVAHASNERPRNSEPDPSGWPSHNPYVFIKSLNDSKDYKGYLYNRSHMLGKSLGGQEIDENMVTGTRTQNVGSNNMKHPGGMAYTESEARDWMQAHRNEYMTYIAKAQYTGNELIPRTTTVDIKTDDDAIDQHVVVYNTVNGFTINYFDGTYTKAK